MKTKFFVLFSVIAVSMFFVSCNKNEDSPSDDELINSIMNADNLVSVTPASLPNEINGTVEENQFDTYVETASHADGLGYAVNMGNGEDLYFAEDCHQLVGKYRYTHCGMMLRPCHNQNGENPNAGNTNGGMHGGGMHGGGTQPGGMGPQGNGEQHPDIQLVDVADLPVAITDYIAENYPDAEIHRAKMRDDNYIVGLGNHIMLLFDSAGNFVQELPFIHHCGGEPVEFDDLLTDISTYIDANYAGCELKRAVKRGDKYVIGLLQNDTRIIVVFSLEGEFIIEHTPPSN